MALDRQTVAKRYGQALFEVAQAKGVRNETLAELNQIKQALDAEPEFITFMTSPSIKHEDKLAILKQITDEASELISLMNLTD